MLHIVGSLLDRVPAAIMNLLQALAEIFYYAFSVRPREMTDKEARESYEWAQDELAIGLIALAAAMVMALIGLFFRPFLWPAGVPLLLSAISFFTFWRDEKQIPPDKLKALRRAYGFEDPEETAEAAS